LGSQASIALSPFIVDADEAAGQSFVYLPTLSASGTWFEDQDVATPSEDIFYCTATNYNACATVSPPVNIKDGIQGLDEKFARGSFVSPQFTTELTWTGRRHLFSRIAENNIPLQNYAQVNSFYTNATNTSIEQLHEARQSIKEALTLPGTDLAALEDYADDIDNYLNDLHQNSEALATDTSVSSITSLLADRTDILADLAETIGMADSLSADLYDELLSNIASAKTVNNSVTATAVYELNEKGYHDLLITSIEEDTFTTAQKNALWSIAHQCPLEGGDGVYHARSLYALIDPLAVYNDVTLCSGQQSLQRPQKNEHLIPGFYFYPNPAKGTMVFNLDQLVKATSVLLEIYHASGYRIHLQSYEVTDGQFYVETSDIENGIYFCRLTLDGQDLGTRKAIILK